jgi:transposase
MDKNSLELLLGQGLSLEEIARRFGKNPSTVAYWVDKHGLEAVNREKHATRGGIEREALAALVEAGMTIAEIAAALERSKTTVRYWLGHYGLKTHNATGRRPAAVAHEAKDAGLLTVTMECRRHGETEFRLEGRGYYRCKRCRSEAVSRRRQRVKAILVAEAGGRCVICGYDRHVAALSFHHLEPDQKLMNVSARGVALAIDTLRAEARKCVLLCANCHAELDNGGTTLPIKYDGLDADGRADVTATDLRADEEAIYRNPG